MDLSGFDCNAVFSGGEYIVLDPVFTGGEINAVFGGIVLDLRKTSLPEGTVFLEMNAVFGGMTLLIPSDWMVEYKVESFAGGVQDSRPQLNVVDTTKKLVLKGSCVFGGVEIKS